MKSTDCYIVIGADYPGSVVEALAEANAQLKEKGMDIILTEENVISPERAREIQQAQSVPIFGQRTHDLVKRLSELVIEPVKMEYPDSPAKLDKKVKLTKREYNNRQLSRHHRNKI